MRFATKNVPETKNKQLKLVNIKILKIPQYLVLIENNKSTLSFRRGTLHQNKAQDLKKKQY